MKVLVAGGDRVDAGKTTFSTGLLDRLGGIGFKPRAGNDYWFDHDNCRRAIEAGRLYGKDAKRLAAASDGPVEPEEINPVHRLWQPAPRGDEFIGPGDRTFLLDRAGDHWIVNDGAAVPSSAAEALPLETARRVGSIDELNDAMAAHALPALRELAAWVRESEPAVIESYGDVARPLEDVAIDRVAVVEPLRTRIYDGQRFLDACDVAGRSPLDGQLEERVGDVIELLDPVATVELPPLTAAEREDPAAVADAYGAAYDALLVD
ncbi:MAG: ATPase [Halobacteriales archaeon]